MVYFPYSCVTRGRQAMSTLAPKSEQGVTTMAMPSVLPSTNLTPLPNFTVAEQIESKYAALGGASGFLGPAQTELVRDPGIKGYHVAYKGGSIYCSAAGGAHAIGGGIGTKWFSLQAQQGLLGYPLTDELTTPDGVGRYNHFEHGSIYWTPATGVHEVHGSIREKWSSLGWEKSFLGCPITDETTTPDGIGRYNHFQQGSIYWTPSTGGHEVHGTIREKWSSLGWEKGFLGYPTTDEISTGSLGGRYSDFQGGSIYWSPRTGAHERAGSLPDHLDFNQDYTFADPIAAGGSTHITLFSDGQAKFSGHFHNSGAIGYQFSVVCVLVDADLQAYTSSHQGTIAGTFTPGSADHDWNKVNTNGLISQNWRAIVATPVFHNNARISTDWKVLLHQVVEAAGIVVSVVNLF